jgi:hypothetical protein
MELEEILKALRSKASETKKMAGLNSKHPAFKNWHATVMQLFRELPSSFGPEINDFKSLAFEDTGFKRGRKFISAPDNSRFLEDLDSSAKILKGIIKKGKAEGTKKEEDKTAPKSKKPAKPVPKKGGAKKTTKKPGPKKAPDSKGARKPSGKGKSATRKKKKS